MLIGASGKQMASQIPQGAVQPGEELPPYQGAMATKKIKDDMLQRLSEESKTVYLQALHPTHRASNSSLDFSNVKGSLKNSTSLQQLSLNNNPASIDPNARHALPVVPGGYPKESTPPENFSVPRPFEEYQIPRPFDEYQQRPQPSAPIDIQGNSQHYQQKSSPPKQFQQASSPTTNPYQQAPSPTSSFHRASSLSNPYQQAPVPTGGGNSYPDYYTTERVAHPEYPYQKSNEEIISCAFCLNGVRVGDMKPHLDSGCKVLVARIN
jgi:hypothetical protein